MAESASVTFTPSTAPTFASKVADRTVWSLRSYGDQRAASPGKSAAGSQSFLYSERGLWLYGDSFRGSRVEDAWLSGDELGEALLGRSV